MSDGEKLLELAARLVIASDILKRHPCEVVGLQQDCLAAASALRAGRTHSPAQREDAHKAVSEILCGKPICTNEGDWLCPSDIDCANEMIAEIVVKVAALAAPQPQHGGMGEASPDDIRALGWRVAVHNDYQLNDLPHTFWLFTKGDRAIKGEGRTDADALNIVRGAIASPDPRESGDAN